MGFPRRAVLAVCIAMSFAGGGCKKKPPPAAASEGPYDKAKRLTSELDALVQAREAAVAKCTGAIFDAAKKTIVDPTDYPKKVDPKDAATMAPAPVFEAVNWKEKKIRQVVDGRTPRDKTFFDAPPFDYKTAVCAGFGGDAAYLAQGLGIEKMSYSELTTHLERLEKELARVKAFPEVVTPTRVAFFWENCDTTPLRTFTDGSESRTINRYACKAGVVWLATGDGAMLASAPGNGSGIPTVAVGAKASERELAAANDDARDRAMSAAMAQVKAIVAKWKPPA